MLSPREIRSRLRAGAEAAWGDDRAALAQTASWLGSTTAREFLRVDDCARRISYEEPTLGSSPRWTSEVLARPLPVVAVLASMHPDGHLRERAVRLLATAPDVVGDRALAVRVSDHVAEVRQPAEREVLRRARLERADHVVPLLHLIHERGRGADVLALYLRALATRHGEARLWARLRGSPDHAVRRDAFDHSFATGLLGPSEAVDLLPRERDQVVRGRLARVIADSATPEVIAEVLLDARSAESRALALSKLTASLLDPADAERLLMDRSSLVRLWARRRWQELGQDPAAVYASVLRSSTTPTVRARAYTGLVETGSAIDRGEVVDLVRSQGPALRKVGLSLLRGRAAAEDLPLLLDAVSDDHSRVARLAGDVLVNSLGLWTVADLAPLKASDDPTLRRRAWWLHRQRGGWETLIADLELLHDPDPGLVALARRPVAPMYFRPTDAQRQRVAELLVSVPLDHLQLTAITVAADLPRPATPGAADRR
jgi:hypothetical protein